VLIQKLTHSYGFVTDHNHKEKKSMVQRTEEPQKVHPTGEFVIVAKFGGHMLHNCECDQAGRQTKNLALAIKKKIKLL